MRVCVIGAGPSGMACAITLAKRNIDVTLFEHGDRVGRKILSTGNGRCNLSNSDHDLSHYHGNREFIEAVFERKPFGSTVSFLTKLGIFTKNKGGYLYPYSEQASAVSDVLRHAMKRYGVKVVTGINVSDIRKTEPEKGNDREGFIIISDQGRECFDRVVIAAGSKAFPKSGSDGSGYELSRLLGHSITEPLPALCALRSDEKFCRMLAGVRSEAVVSLEIDTGIVKSDTGEVQFTDYGLSGIPVFQLSYLAVRALYRKKKVRIHLDLMPLMDKDTLSGFLFDRKSSDETKSCGEFLTGILNKNLSLLIIKLAGLSQDGLLSETEDSEIEMISGYIKDLTFNISGYNSFDKAQICQGGVCTGEISADMQSKLVKGLYFAGEIIDVNGDCGGYNLTWAFNTGMIAGEMAKEQY